MTDPMDTDALRGTASDLRETDWVPWQTQEEARENWQRIEKAADEVERLRAVIENAPHAEECPLSFAPTPGTYSCNCWKADAL